MIKSIRKATILGIILISFNVHAQIININDAGDVESALSLQQLVENVLISGGCAQVDAFSEQVSGIPIENETKSYGFFKKPAGSRFPFEEGVVLTTGRAFEAGNTTVVATGSPSNDNGMSGDTDLEIALGITNTNDATFIKFNFVPSSTTISFRFLMASEEYDGTTECNFADGFAFLLREVGATAYTNLAVLPDDTPVSVTNINNSGACAANIPFFEGYDLEATNYGGRTVVLTASSGVTPGQTYEIKLVVADQGDSVWDSAIFLEAGSFVLGADLGDSHLTASNTAACGTSVLLDATITAPDYNWYFDDGSGFSLIAGENNQIYTANLGNGTYKVEAILGAGCIAEDEIVVEFVTQPTATMPTPLSMCDADNDGSIDFNLTDKEAEILDGQSPTDFEVLYYRDAAYTDQIIGADITSFTSTGQTIYARVRNLSSTNCIADTSFDLEVYETAFPSTTVSLLAECDNTSVGTDTDGLILFNLHDRTTEILNGQSAADFTLSYFTDAAFTAQIPVADEIAFTNTIAGGQTIFVRMTNNLNTTCFTDTSFEIEVFELPVLNTPPYILEQCDDDFNGFNSFNLTEINTDIVTTITDEVFTYYENLADAEAGIAGTEIPNITTYVNEVVNTDNTIWTRIENANGCYRTTQIELVVKPSAIPSTFLRTFSQCDDPADTTDGISTFDFSSVTAEIQALFPTAIDVFYYRNAADATAEINEIPDPSNYENIGSPNMQEIWVRADSVLGNDCLGNGHHITLIVEALPTANKPTDLTECDDDQDGIFPFDVSNVEAEILGGQSLTDLTITYFNEDGTLIGTSLPNPFSTASQTIDIIVTNNVTSDPDGACSNATTLIFTVDALPINEVQPIAPLCETDPEDGLLIATFDTSNLENSINAQAGMDITYLDALGNPLEDMDGNLIVSPFPSSFTTETQTITVVVTNPINTTCPSLATVEFIVNPRPIFDIIEEDIVCENILPHTITAENPEAVYTYEWFNSLGTSIGTNQTLNITNTDDITIEGVDYTIIATNPITNCEREKTFTLRKSSIATLLDEDIVTVEFNSPANSIEIITTNLGSGDYEFSLQHDADSRPWQDEPIFTNLQGGMYTVLINDKNGCGEAIPKVIFLLDYPKFLTPNNDGYNDVWQLIGLDSTAFAISPIQIFDRFGKIIAIINPTATEGWDGLYNNRTLPSSDYWFALTLTNSDGETFLKRGHFSLIRRGL